MSFFVKKRLHLQLQMQLRKMAAQVVAGVVTFVERKLFYY